jgi:hypothetical protein
MAEVSGRLQRACTAVLVSTERSIVGHRRGFLTVP